MPITSRSFVQSTVILLVLALVALIGIVGTTIFLGERSQDYFNEVLAARDARTAAVDVRNLLQVAESGQRGFLLTGSEDYLDRYDRAKDAVGPRVEAFAAIMKPSAPSTAAVADLKSAIDQKMAELAQTIALKRVGNDAAATAIVNTNRGKALMDKATAFLGQTIADADDRVTRGVSDQRINATWLRWVSILGGLVIIGVASVAVITVLRYTRELIGARAEVTALNTDLEARVSDRTAALTQANDEIQRFAYIVTHDLRAPLVNIMGFTSELETSVQSLQALVEKTDVTGDRTLEEARNAATTDLPEAIGFIRSSTRKMDGLINAILKLSREGRRTLKPERLEIAEVVQATADALRHQVDEADGEVVINLKLPALVTDRLSIEQLFGNLLDNAIKYRSRSRPLRIAVRGNVLPGNRIQVDVEDNGRGIAAQDGERVFELFRRSGTQDQPGEGIGLAYVRALVRNLGGDITMSSTLDVGTTFRITLPLRLPLSRSSAA